MYHVGKQIHRHRKVRKRLIVLVVVVVFAGLIYWLTHLRIAPKQELYNSAPLSDSYNVSENKKIKIDKPLFQLELPSGWKENSIETSPLAPKFRFSNPEPKAGGQMVELYIDTVPTSIAINKVVVVTPTDDGLSHEQVSENCTSFTDTNLTNPQTGTALARWQTINFICDTGNYSRQVVGVASTEGINQVTVTGPTSGMHKIFIVYNDNNITPDYNILYDILNSLHFK